MRDNGHSNDFANNQLEQCAIVSFSIKGQDPAQIVQKLKDKNIIIGASSPDSTLLDAQSRKLPVILRAAPHYYNTKQEIDALVQALDMLK